MRSFFSEKNLVVILFIMVLITFSLAQEDSRKLETINSGSAIHEWRTKESQKMTDLAPEKISTGKIQKELPQ